MKYTTLAFIIIIILTACGSEKNRDTVDSNSKFSSTKIIALITDVQLLESLINTHGGFRKGLEQNLLFQEILDKHQYTRQEFDSVFKYLETNLELYTQILDSVKINLENMKIVDLPFLQKIDTSNRKIKPFY